MYPPIVPPLSQKRPPETSRLGMDLGVAKSLSKDFTTKGAPLPLVVYVQPVSSIVCNLGFNRVFPSSLSQG